MLSEYVIAAGDSAPVAGHNASNAFASVAGNVGKQFASPLQESGVSSHRSSSFSCVECCQLCVHAHSCHIRVGGRYPTSHAATNGNTAIWTTYVEEW